MKLSAGVVDAGASSLATFIAAFVAARTLTDAEMGAYALVFAAWTLATQLPAQLVFAPAEAGLVRLGPGRRLGHLGLNLRYSLPWSMAAVLCVAIVYVVLPSDVSSNAGLQLTLTGAVAAAFSPAQEHARQLLHLARAHWAAAWVSVGRVVLVAIALAAAAWAGLPPALAPLGSLALADGICLLAVTLMARGGTGSSGIYDSRGLVRLGSWLLVSAMAAPIAGFFVNLILAQMVSSASLGLAEQARIAAQPVLVLGVGLSAVMRPSSMRAAVDLDRDQANSINRRFQLLVLAFVAAALAVSVAPGPLNILRWAIPRAFVEPGLVQVSMLAAAANAWVMLRRSELIALGRTRHVAVVEGWSALSRVPLAFASRVMQSWVVPVAFLVSGLTRVIGFDRALAERRSTPAG